MTPSAAGQPGYRGRFAPSPTGPLHLGSLIAALASYLDARSHGGAWLVRMEDLDPPREQPGAAAAILSSLQAHGLHWDGQVLRQSERAGAYRAALERLAATGMLFACGCSRRELGPGGACCGECRRRPPPTEQPHALRVMVPADTRIAFTDGLQGRQQFFLDRACADFTLLRKDGLFAYQLAVVVDDAAQEINCVVRGCDLLDSTPRQLFLQQLLGLASPAYLHLPVITNASGQKLSKQNHAPPLQDAAAPANLRLALRFLGQPEPPSELTGVNEILAYARRHWSRALLPGVPAIPESRLTGGAG